MLRGNILSEKRRTRSRNYSNMCLMNVEMCRIGRVCGRNIRLLLTDPEPPQKGSPGTFERPGQKDLV